MRRALLAAVSTIALATPAFIAPSLAADRSFALDLIAKFILGVDEGVSLGMPSESTTSAVVKKTGPGAYSMDMGSGNTFAFAVSEKSNCVFDIGFTQNGTYGGGIEVDATKLKSVAYEAKDAAAGDVHEYVITLTGGENLIQYLGQNGELSHAEPTSTLDTSLTDFQMLEAVAAFQAAYCPAMA